jgi:hypothetical protein
MPAEAAAAAPAGAEGAGEPAAAAEGEGEAGETPAKPKRAGISALYVENNSSVEQEVVVCVCSTCFKCPVTVQELNVSAWQVLCLHASLVHKCK